MKENKRLKEIKELKETCLVKLIQFVLNKTKIIFAKNKIFC
jgi:hypothetical protein